MEKVKRRINDWKIKSLSLAGRAQLIRSLLSSTHIYWASVFILPSSLMLELEQLMRGFLWCQCEMRKGKAKVGWEDVCLLTKEGGLGIRQLERFNKALISTHIWSLLLNKESLWVKWIHAYKLNGRTLWEIPLRGKMSWGWRKILQRNISNVDSDFSIANAWDCIRPRVMRWIGFMLFGSRTRFLVMHSPLAGYETQAQDSRYTEVWNQMKSFTGIPNIPFDLSSIVDFLIPLAKMRSVRSGVVKLVFAATSYFIWQERNNRLFMKTTRARDQVISIIKSTVRLKLLTCKFKKTKNVQMIIHLWKLPTSLSGSSPH
uniref:Reverse transcriptase domain, reverse transcriptase zinc-binding domain protein n=1 Tax=Tanacetum cinerariifolium TaxID=118510 RepID=A0A6L2J5S2_TANCI|nr:hypothetical protein [Tanacetum cinerariifolium]